MSYAPYLEAIGLGADSLEPDEVERLGRLAANEVCETARELALAGWKPGDPENVTAQCYLEALCALSTEQKALLRKALLSAPAWWSPCCGSVVRAGFGDKRHLLSGDHGWPYGHAKGK